MEEVAMEIGVVVGSIGGVFSIGVGIRSFKAYLRQKGWQLVEATVEVLGKDPPDESGCWCRYTYTSAYGQLCSFVCRVHREARHENRVYVNPDDPSEGTPLTRGQELARAIAFTLGGIGMGISCWWLWYFSYGQHG